MVVVKEGDEIKFNLDHIRLKNQYQKEFKQFEKIKNQFIWEFGHQGNILNYEVKQNNWDLIILSNILHFINPIAKDLVNEINEKDEDFKVLKDLMPDLTADLWVKVMPKIRKGLKIPGICVIIVRTVNKLKKNPSPDFTENDRYKPELYKNAYKMNGFSNPTYLFDENDILDLRNFFDDTIDFDELNSPTSEGFIGIKLKEE